MQNYLIDIQDSSPALEGVGEKVKNGIKVIKEKILAAYKFIMGKFKAFVEKLKNLPKSIGNISDKKSVEKGKKYFAHIHLCLNAYVKAYKAYDGAISDMIVMDNSTNGFDLNKTMENAKIQRSNERLIENIKPMATKLAERSSSEYLAKIATMKDVQNYIRAEGASIKSDLTQFIGKFKEANDAVVKTLSKIEDYIAKKDERVKILNDLMTTGNSLIKVYMQLTSALGNILNANVESEEVKEEKESKTSSKEENNNSTVKLNAPRV